ncbi:MAG: metal ABC transporter solute-binding protein, Zn/Mn family [Roseiflexaceae bacterium]|jgi:manganese/zinc/iron transport system substrate-binding protein
MHRRQIIKLFGLLPLISACAIPGIADAQKILSTTSQIGDIVTQLIGDAVAHSSLIRTGLDPHTYKATQSDLLRFQEARLILSNGLNLEASLARVLTQMPSPIRVASLADAFRPSELLGSVHGNEFDPHIWFDTQLWRKAVAFVAEAISTTYVQLQPGMAERLQDYDRALVALTSELRTEIDQIPPDRRVLITAHDAFGYFGRAYGFDVLGVQGLSTATEAGIQNMSRLADVIVTRNVPAVFVESTVSPRTIEALQAAVSDRGGRVNVGGELYSDSLGDPNTDAATYVGMMRHNVKTIVAALQGAQ